MKIICLSDVHLSTEKPQGRTDDWETEQWRKLEFVINRASELGAVIIQAGDLCDRPRNWQLLLQLNSFLRNWEVPWFMVRGQHDMYMHSPESATTITVLKEFSDISLVELDGAVVGDLTDPLAITGVRWGSEVPKESPIQLKGSKTPHVMIIHAPIAEAPVFERHDYIDARGFAEKHRGYDLILCGDIHRHFCIRTKWNVIVNTGPMMRREATEYNLLHQPCFYVYDTDTKGLTREIIPHRPAEEILSRKHLEVQQDIKTLLSDFVEKVKKTLSKESPGVDVMANFQRAFKAVDFPQSTRDLIMEVINDPNGK